MNVALADLEVGLRRNILHKKRKLILDNSSFCRDNVDHIHLSLIGYSPASTSDKRVKWSGCNTLLLGNSFIHDNEFDIHARDW